MGRHYVTFRDLLIFAICWETGQLVGRVAAELIYG